MTLVALLALAGCGNETRDTGGEDTGADCSYVFFPDADGDAHGDPSAPTEPLCVAPAGYVATGDDCDDADAAVHPDAIESCDGIDDDCDQIVDDDTPDLPRWYADADGDGFGAELVATACEGPVGAVTAGNDCDDADAAVNPDAVEVCGGGDEDCDGFSGALDPDVQAPVSYDDDDGDGFGDPSTASATCTPAAGAVLDGSDCNDVAPTIHPGVDEICDGVDDDCDGLVDDDDDVLVAWTFYADDDGDGLGDPAVPRVACVAPDGFVDDDRDCDDAAADVGAASLYYADADADGYGAGVGAPACAPAAGTTLEGGDCSSLDASIHPGAIEICNGRDDDCDSLIDDHDPSLVGDVWYADKDGDDYGDDADTVASCDAVSGYLSVGGDCNDFSTDFHPTAPEWCDGYDQDCDGVVDNDVVYRTYYADDDGDGYGDGAVSTSDCVAPSGYTSVRGDCDDGDAAISPDATETCSDGTDADCDGVVDNCTQALADAWLTVVGDDGTALTGVGSYADVADLDGDGTADLVLGCGSASSNWGQVAIVSGPDHGTVDAAGGVVLSVPASLGAGLPYFGEGIATADANGDGLDDVFVGAPGGPFGIAAAIEGGLLFLGPITASLEWTDADLAVLAPTTGVMSVAIVPDVDGDAVADVVVGSPGLTSGGGVYVAAADATGSVDLTADSIYVFEPGATSDRLGTAVTSVGDTNGDGIGDLAVSADGVDTDQGAVYIIEGGAAAGTYDVETAAAALIDGSDDGGHLGDALTSADLDGDGTADLVVGGPQIESMPGIESGAAYAFLGPFTGTIRTIDAETTWVGQVDAALGTSVAANGDANGDGVADVLLGTPGYPDSRGSAYLQLGPASGVIEIDTLRCFAGEVTGDMAGSSVTFVPDWSGDGASEIGIGAPGAVPGSGRDLGAFYAARSDDL